MIIKVKFEGDFDYIYCPENIGINIKEEFYNWIDFTTDEHPFLKYDDEFGAYLDYRGDALVYWLNKYILTDKNSDDEAKVIKSFTNENLKYDLEIPL
ncbi:MAG: hypothetical protein RSD36_18090 [Terrisporobacter sp.]